MAKLQGQTRRGYLHELPLGISATRLDSTVSYWLRARNSPYWKLHYIDDAGVRWTFRMKNR